MRTLRSLGLAIALCAALASLQVGSAEAAVDEVHWTITGQTSVTFDWRGAENTIRFGLTTSYGQTVTASTPSPLPFSSAGPFWEARLTGLQENTLYHYSIGGGADHTFRTPPPRGSSDFTVYVEGDIGDASSYPRMATVQSLIPAGAPPFVLMVGDLTYGNAHGQATVDRHFNDVMVWSQDAAYMPAWGNHEWDAPSADDLRNYKGRFDFPNPQTSPGSPAVSCCGEDWYWFDYGNVRFIAYPEPWSGALADWRTKAAALMDGAQSDPAIKFIVTFGHRPAYSSGHHPGEGTLKSYLDGLGATHSKYVLNLNGHSHNYERTFPQSGVVHITAGTGGGTLEQDGSCLWLACTQPAWSAYRAMYLGTLALRFTATGIQGSFLCGPTGGGTNDVSCSLGSVLDAFTIGVRSGAPLVTAPAAVSGTEGVALTVSVEASDPDGDPITSLTADLSALPSPNNARFTAGAGNTSSTLTWTPAAGDARQAPYNVLFTASNALSGIATTAITVVGTNQNPTAALSVTPSTGNAPLFVAADASGSSDPDGSVVSHRFDFGDGTTVGPQASPTATHTYAAGNWTAGVLVTDDRGGTATATASVTVTTTCGVDTGPNLVGNPSFETDTAGWTGNGGATIQQVADGLDGGFSLEMHGPATGTPKFGVNDSPNWVASTPVAGTLYRFTAWVRSSTASGQGFLRVREYQGSSQQGVTTESPPVALTPTWQKVTVDYTATAAGTTLDLQVLDAPAVPDEVFQTDNISIQIVAAASCADRAPTAAAPATTTVAEASLLTVSISASDPDGEAITSLTADLTGLPAGNDAQFSSPPPHSSGTLTWTPTYADARPAPYEVVFTVSNTLSGTDTTEITVTNVDRAPAATAPATATVEAGTLLTVSVTASDPDGEAITSLTADLTGLPAGNDAQFSSPPPHTSGSLTWTPTTGDVSATPYNVVFTATNALSGSATTAITVMAGNRNPTAVLTVTPSAGNAPLFVTADASGSGDSDGSVVSYRFDFGDGTIVGPQSGLTATHTYAAGSWTASVLVTDNAGATATASDSVDAASVGLGPNLVGNPSFETNTTGWNGTGGATIQRVAGGLDGGYSLEIRGPATGADEVEVNDSPNWVTSTSAAGTKYRFTAWVRSSTAAGRALLRVREYVGGSQKGVTTFSPTVTLTPSWQAVTVDYATRVSGSTLDFQVLDAPVATAEAFQTDNISIRIVSGGPAAPQITSPTPLAAVVAPNPLNPEATVAFTTSREGAVSLRIYDATGRWVRTLLRETHMPVGRHAIRFDGRDAAGGRLATGIYFYRLEAGRESTEGRVLIIK